MAEALEIENVKVKLGTESPKRSYRNIVGVTGTLILSLYYAIAGSFVYILYIFNRNFVVGLRKTGPLSALYIFLALAYVLTGSLLACRWSKTSAEYSKQRSSKRRASKRMPGWFHAVKDMFDTFFDVQGAKYLYKLYLFEFVENIVQFVNFFQVYSCNMDVNVLSFVCCCFLAEAVVRCKNTYDAYHQRWTVRGRSGQVKLDLAIDIFFTVAPICMIWFLYDIPLRLEEITQMIFVPSLMVLLKLRSILRLHIREQGLKIDKAINRSFSRSTVFSEDESVGTQSKACPKFGFKVWFLYNVIASIFYACILVYHQIVYRRMLAEDFCAGTFGEVQSKTLWREGCLVKIPFCNDWLGKRRPCNCAVIDINKAQGESHNLTAIPSSVVTEMKHLKRFTFQNGPLKDFPDDFHKMEYLARVDFSYNSVEVMPPFSEKDTPDLIFINAISNQLNEIPLVMWEHGGVVVLKAGHNSIHDIPRNVGKMKMLSTLSLYSNLIGKIPDELFDLELLSILDLGMNNVSKIPPSILKRKEAGFKTLWMSGNTLNILPDRFFEIECGDLDLRNNSLRALPKWTSDSAIGDHFFLADNPVCTISTLRKALDKEILAELERVETVGPNRKWAEGCVRQCALSCFDYYREDTECDMGCNVKECSYDNGDCDI